MEQVREYRLPNVLHVLIAGTLVLMVTLAWHNFTWYTLLSYEDHLLEWATVVFFLAAAVYGLWYAVPRRRFGDGLVALYCLVAGGEEFSWGQRLIGLSPPKFFMAGNEQQEINFHNFLSGGSHDILFAIIALGYFVFVPLATRFFFTRKLLAKLRLSAPPCRLGPWAVLLTALHLWHPFLLSTEWYEAILAGMFFATSATLAHVKLTTKFTLIGVAAVLLISGGLMQISLMQEAKHDRANTACARLETQQLLNDLLNGAATVKVRLMTGHIRVYEAMSRGLVDGSRLSGFKGAQCEDQGVKETLSRRDYSVDPWGMSYWLHIQRQPDDSMGLTIYSFGPNRRRDSGEVVSGSNVLGQGDDIAQVGALPFDPSQRPPATVFSVEDGP